MLRIRRIQRSVLGIVTAALMLYGWLDLIRFGGHRVKGILPAKEVSDGTSTV